MENYMGNYMAITCLNINRMNNYMGNYMVITC